MILDTASLLRTEVQEFIHTFSGDLANLAFSGSPFPDIPVQELIRQIESRMRIQKKLPHWFQTHKIVYPPKLNLEQSSSETTARYKAELISGKKLADITGGFGVDSYYFSKQFDTVHHFELDNALSSIVSHNFEVLQQKNITCFVGDGLEGIKNNFYDVIYADPSRRNQEKGKVFYLRDCLPNIPKHLPTLFSSSKKIMLKVSPMLDISIGIDELQTVYEIHIIAVKNEVKELLMLLTEEKPQEITIKTINFTTDDVQTLDFRWRQPAIATYCEPQSYLYEPNAALYKSGAFDFISEHFGIDKLASNTHLYTSDRNIDFPGRRFRIIQRIPYQKTAMRSLKNSKANITTRNFPEPVAQIRKKWKINSGGETYLFFVTLASKHKEVLVCEKI